MGGDELKLAKQDLKAGGQRVAGVVRLNNRKQEPSLAVKISLEATELPSEVWLGATPFTVQAFANSSVERNRPAAPSAGKVRTHTNSATRRSSA